MVVGDQEVRRGRHRRWLIAALGCVAGWAGCDDGAPETLDEPDAPVIHGRADSSGRNPDARARDGYTTRPDATRDAAADAGTDGGPDGQSDSVVDASEDARSDGASDVSPDDARRPDDGTLDAAVDGAGDGAADGALDMASDAPLPPPPDANIGPLCSATADCPEPHLCVDGRCAPRPRIRCADDGDCPGAAECDRILGPPFGICTAPTEGCEADLDCPGPDRCDLELGRCAICLEAEDCPGATRCAGRPGGRYCAEAQPCEEDAGCLNGRRCIEGTCRWPAACDDDLIDIEHPDDGPDTAWPVGAQLYMGGRLCPGDADWRRVRVPAGHGLIATAWAAHSGAGLEMSWMSEAGAEPAEVRAGVRLGPFAQVRVPTAAVARDVRIELRASGGGAATDYDLEVSLPVCADAIDEPADQLDAATDWDRGPVEGALCEGDVDWFVVGPAPGGTEAVQVRLLWMSGDPVEISWVSLDGETVVESQEYGAAPARLQAPLGDADALALRLRLVDGGAASYRIDAAFGESGVDCDADAFEDNDTYATASPLDTEPLDGLRTCADEGPDWYRVAAVAGERLEIQIIGDPDRLWADAQNEAGESVAWTERRPDGWLLTVPWARGDVVFVVRDQGGWPGQTYGLRVLRFPAGTCVDDPGDALPGLGDGPDQPVEIGVGRHDAAVCAEDDDWYAVAAAAGDRIDVRVIPDRLAPFGARVELVDGAGEVVVGGQPSETGWRVDAVLAGEGPHLLRVGTIEAFGGRYELEVEIEYADRGNGTCVGADSIVQRRSMRVAGNTAGGESAVNMPAEASCTGFATAGPDLFYRLDLVMGAEVGASLTSDADLALYVLSECDDAESACVAGADAVIGGTERLAFRAMPGTYLFGVDAEAVGAAFTLEVSVDPACISDDLPPCEGCLADRPCADPQAVCDGFVCTAPECLTHAACEGQCGDLPCRCEAERCTPADCWVAADCDHTVPDCAVGPCACAEGVCLAVECEADEDCGLEERCARDRCLPVGGHLHDTCDVAQPLDLRPHVPLRVGGTTRLALDDEHGLCGGLGGPDVVYAVEVPAETQRMAAALISADDAYSPVLAVRRGCVDGIAGPELECGADTLDTPAGTSQVVLDAPEAGAYLLHADGPWAGDFVLEVALEPGCIADADCPGERQICRLFNCLEIECRVDLDCPAGTPRCVDDECVADVAPAGLLCASPQRLPLEAGHGLTDGTTAEGARNLVGHCGGDGAEWVFEIDVGAEPTSLAAQVVTLDASWAPVLYARAQCDSPVELACGADEPADGHAGILLPEISGPLHLIVDGVDEADAGEFLLRVAAPGECLVDADCGPDGDVRCVEMLCEP